MFQIKDYTFRYPNNEKDALSHVNLTIQEGHFYVICGVSGCGKTTLLRSMKPGLSPVGEVSGEIQYKNRLVEDLDAFCGASEIGYLLQDAEAQLVTDTVWHELSFALENLNTPMGQMRGRVAEIAACFGLEALLDKKVDELSGGQQQILNLASIMTLSPKVLLLDEPCAKLDPLAVVEFMALIHRIHIEYGITVVMIEQRLEDVLFYATDVVLMEQGQVVANVPKEEFADTLLGRRMEFMLPPAMQLGNYLRSKGVECNHSVYSVAEGRKLLKKYLENIDNPKVSPLIDENIDTHISQCNLMKNISFRYEKQHRDILRQTSFSIQEAKITALLGGNGAGKSTLLKVIIGACKPYRGKLLYKGTCGYLPQDAKMLFLQDTIGEELQESVTSEAEQTLLEYYIDQFDIRNILNKHPYDVSGGEIERGALVKVLLKRPKLLLLDEPTLGLDANSKLVLGQLLDKLKQQGITVLMVTHDLEFCGQVADACAMLFAGEIVTQDSMRSFFDKQQFYTTQVARMTRDVLPNCVIIGDVIKTLP